MTEKHPIDQEFLDLMRKIQSEAVKLNPQEIQSVKTWIGKLTGTNPNQRNEYAKCLMHQVESGKLGMPFTEVPEKFVELPPLHEALHGPLPDLSAPKTTTWRSGRSKAETTKKMTQKELKSKYGTDRVGLHTCLRDVTDTDDFTVQGLVALAGQHTKDGGGVLIQIMQEELQEFRAAVKNFYTQHSTVMAEQVEKEQIEMKQAFEAEASSLRQKKVALEDQLKNADPEFDWDWFRNYNKVDAEQKKRLKKLRQRVVRQEERNRKAKDVVAELQVHLAAHEEEMRKNENDISLGLLPDHVLNATNIST